ncbi:MAG: phytoene/squalene synthase family protein [Saprospiraceae bacterium]
MDKLYSKTCAECSQIITKRYSTSFSLGIRLFEKKLRAPICSIYGFVRFADEIVDTFHGFEKGVLLNRFREDTYRAIEEKISLNPVLHSFQEVVHQYAIGLDLIDAFLDSMEMDLHFSKYEDSLYKQYIYGSAEVVGLMCLRVFTNGNEEEYKKLQAPAQALGSAFQKINFLRDIKSDFDERGRTYFPGIDYRNFTDVQKTEIEMDIKNDFDHGYQGIVQLPVSARLGVYLAYKYYINLFHKIKRSPASKVKEERIRINNRFKLYLLCRSALRHSLNML